MCTLEIPIKTYEVLRPTHLYHGSPKKNLTLLEPRAVSIRDQNEGPVIFAGPTKACATMFLVPSDDRWTAIGKTNGIYTMVIGDRDRFIQADKGGAVYEVPSDSFTCDPNKGMGTEEWASKIPVTPTNITLYNNAVDAMIDEGVQVYFLDKDKFEEYRNERRYHGRQILYNLESENQKRNKNVKLIEQR